MRFPGGKLDCKEKIFILAHSSGGTRHGAYDDDFLADRVHRPWNPMAREKEINMCISFDSSLLTKPIVFIQAPP